MLDYSAMIDRYNTVSNYLNTDDMTEEGNVRPKSETVQPPSTPVKPVVAAAPENQYVEQAEEFAMGVSPDTNVDGMQLAAATGTKRQRGVVTAPVAPEALPGESQMDTYIRTQESGGKPDIGYHYEAGPDGKRKSTAYGAYGITAPAYRDIQVADPYFRGRPINSLSTTEQTRANQIYSKVQEAQLRNLGIEPTEENLRGAQLLGARGLKRYLENGTFSNEAARANGGAQNLERIVRARMGGQSAPSSQPNLPPQPEAPAPEAAAPAPAPAPAGDGQRIDTQGFENLQPAPDAVAGAQVDKNQQFNDVLTNNFSDPSAMAQLAYNPQAPESVRRAASDQLFTLMQKQREENKAAGIIQAAQTDPKAAKKLSRELSRPSEEGSYLKAYLYTQLGFDDLAKAEQIKLGAGDHWGQSFVAGKDGQPQAVWIKYNGQGAPIKGYSAEGELDERQLLTAMTTKGMQGHTGKMKSRITGKVYYEYSGPGGTILKTPTGEVYTGDTRDLFPYGIGSDLDTKNQLQIQEFINRATFEPRIEGKKAQYKAAMELAEKNDPGDGSVIRSTIERLAQNDVIYDPNTKDFTIGPRAMQAAPSQQPPAAPDQRQAPAAVPSQQPPAAAPAPAADMDWMNPQPGDDAAIKAILKGVYGPQKRRGESENAYQDRLKDENARRQAVIELRKKQAMIPLEVNQKEQEKFIDTGKEISKQAEDARVVAGARKRQIGVIKENPQVVGLMYGTGSKYDHARNYVLNLLNGYYDDPVKNKEKREALDLIGKNGLADAVAQLEADSLLINSKTIRDTAPVGAITDYEQNMNNKLNLGNITGGHPMAIANKFNQQLFASNLTLYKNKFLNDGSLSGKFKTDREFNQAWSKEESRLLKEYEGIYQARMEMIKPYEEALRKAEKENKDTSKLAEDRKKAIIHSMTVYPAPNYDVMTNTWTYGSDAARKVAKKTAMDNVLKGK